MSQRKADAAVRQARARVLRLAKDAEDEIERRLRAQKQPMIAALVADGVTAGEAKRVVERAILDTVAQRTAVIRGAIREAAMGGRVASVQGAKAAFGPEVPVPTETVAELRAAVDRQLAGRLAIDRVALTRRMHRNAKAVTEGLRLDLEASLRAGDGVIRAAKRLIKADAGLMVQVPEYVREIRDLVKGGASKAELRAAVAKHARQIGKLGNISPGTEYTLRGASKKFMAEAKRATAKDIGATVDRWIERKAIQTERTVARTEMNAAFKRSYEANAEAQPFTEALQWNLSHSHPVADICDVLANQDVAGLGPGVYPVGQVPEPGHPRCLCFTTAIVDTNHFRRQIAEKRGEEPPPPTLKQGKPQTGAAWLKAQPKSVQVQVLGPTRAKMLDKHGDKLFDAKGNIRPVYDLLGKKPPARGAVLVPAQPSIARNASAKR